VTQIYYFISSSGQNPVKDFIDSLEKIAQAKLLRLFQAINLYGLPAVLPHVKRLTGTPLYELRIVGKDNIRLMYFVPLKERIVVLHGFIKTTNKTPVRELTIALKRLQEYQLTI
jgi:phage-related protein